MKTIFAAFAAIALAIIGKAAFSEDTPASPAKNGDNGTAAKDDSSSKERPEDAVYCTLLCSEKLAADLHLTEDQHAELDKLQEQLKATILQGGVRSQQHGGLPSGKARTLVKMTEARLTYVGGKIKGLLTPKQDRVLNELYSSGKLRPIEVAAAEVHDPKHGTKGKFFGQIVLVPHYEDAATNAEKSATQGAMRGAHSEGSYYRDSSSPKLGAASEPAKTERSSSDDDIETLLANLKKAGHERVKLTFALRPIEERLPRAPNPAMAEALEKVLLENATDSIRISAANSLANWGRPESIPALQKAAKSSEPRVAEAAKKAIKALTSSSTPDGESNDSAEKPPEKSAAAPLRKRQPAVQPKPLRPADRDKFLADVKSDDATKRQFAILRIVGNKPAQPDPQITEALVQTLSEDADGRIRGLAAWALQNWGTLETIPALKKALDDPDRKVQLQSKKAIEKISSEK